MLAVIFQDLRTSGEMVLLTVIPLQYDEKREGTKLLFPFVSY